MVKISRVSLVAFIFALSLWGLPPRASAGTENEALVIIDMQSYFMTRGGNADLPENMKKVKRLLDAQMAAIQAAKQANMPIIFLEYESAGVTNGNLEGAARVEKIRFDNLWSKIAKDPRKLKKKEFINSDQVAYFLKNTDGMFDEENSHKKELVDYLTKKNIKTLIVTGANGGACVQASIQGALNNHINVIAYDAAIADFNYQDFLYPYDQYYRETIHPTFSNCKFKETSNLSDIFPQETSGTSQRSLKGVIKKSDEVREQIDKMNPKTKECDR